MKTSGAAIGNKLVFTMVLACMATAAIPAAAQDDVLAIARTDSVYESVLTKDRVSRTVMSWYTGWSARPKDMTDAAWVEERRHIMEESIAAGMDGPFAPTSAAPLGMKEM